MGGHPLVRHSGFRVKVKEAVFVWYARARVVVVLVAVLVVVLASVLAAVWVGRPSTACMIGLLTFSETQCLV